MIIVSTETVVPKEGEDGGIFKWKRQGVVTEVSEGQESLRFLF